MGSRIGSCDPIGFCVNPSWKVWFRWVWHSDELEGWSSRKRKLEFRWSQYLLLICFSHSFIVRRETKSFIISTTTIFLYIRRQIVICKEWIRVGSLNNLKRLLIIRSVSIFSNVVIFSIIFEIFFLFNN